MDDATKRGYGMMMLEQGLPKSHFYASAIARLKRDVARDVGPPVKPHLPFGVLGSGRDRVPSTDLAAITAKLDRLHANLEAFRGERAADLEPRGDGRDPATVALYDSPAGGAAPAPWADGADGSSASEPPNDKDSSASGPSADGGGSLLSDSRGADGDGPEEVPSEVDSKLSDFDDDDLAGLGLQTDSSDGGDGGAA